MKIFALGILAFLSGRFLYIAALIHNSGSLLIPAVLIATVLPFAAIPPLMKRIIAPTRGPKIFGYSYLVVVIVIFSCATVQLVRSGVTLLNIVFAVRALLCMVSDFIMICYSFGKKIKPLRAINPVCYYIDQLLIAVSICFAG